MECWARIALLDDTAAKALYTRLHCGRWDNGTVENKTWPQFWVQDSRVCLDFFICSTCPEGRHRGCRCTRTSGRSKVGRPLLKFLGHWRLCFWLRRSSKTGKQHAGRMPGHSSYWQMAHQPSGCQKWQAFSTSDHPVWTASWTPGRYNSQSKLGKELYWAAPQ